MTTQMSAGLSGVNADDRGVAGTTGRTVRYVPAVPLYPRQAAQEDTNMTNIDSASQDKDLQDPFALPPIPLVTGQVVAGEAGAVHRIVSVALVLRCDDGTEKTVELRQEHGAWWAP